MLTNATLTTVDAAGVPDRYGETTTPGAPAWQGAARGYLHEINRTVPTGGSGSVERTDTTLIRVTVFTARRAEGAPAVDAAGDDARGSTVVIQDARRTPPVARRFRIVAIEDRRVGSITDSIRLELDDEQTA